MTPAQLQQKLKDLRTKKSQMDAKVSAMADKVNSQIEPLDGYRSKMVGYWEKWKSKNHIIMKERTVGKDKGKFMIRRSWSLLLPEQVEKDYMTAWRSAPGAIKAITEMLEDLYKVNKDLQQAKRNVLAVVIPSSVSNLSELAKARTSLGAAQKNANQAMDGARKVLRELPARAKKVEPLMRVLIKYLVIAIAILKAERNRLGDKLSGSADFIGKDKDKDKDWKDWKITKAAKKTGKAIKEGVESVKDAAEAVSRKSRHEYLSGLIPVLEGFMKTALEYIDKAVAFIQTAPAREKEIASEQSDFNKKISDMNADLSLALGGLTPGGSSNRPEAGPREAVLHLLAIGAVAAGICAFDHYERKA
jgi:hypothetical protein